MAWKYKITKTATVADPDDPNSEDISKGGHTVVVAEFLNDSDAVVNTVQFQFGAGITKQTVLDSIAAAVVKMRDARSLEADLEKEIGKTVAVA